MLRRLSFSVSFPCILFFPRNDLFYLSLPFGRRQEPKPQWKLFAIFINHTPQFQDCLFDLNADVPALSHCKKTPLKTVSSVSLSTSKDISKKFLKISWQPQTSNFTKNHKISNFTKNNCILSSLQCCFAS